MNLTLKSLRVVAVIIGMVAVAWPPHPVVAQETTHPGTKPLTWEGDLASRMVEQADAFLLEQLDASIAQRAKHWNRDTSSADAYNTSVVKNRDRLKHILGVRSERQPFGALELVATTSQPAKVGESPLYRVYAVRWPVVRDMQGEGLLLVPKKDRGVTVIAIPDADQTPEQIAGLTDGVPGDQQLARRLAESGCRVIVPSLINRHRERRLGGATLTAREFVHRSAFELGRHIAGYEIQKVLGLVDWVSRDSDNSKIAVAGWGEGGMIALYSAAIDTRIDVALVSGYFDSRQSIWSQPIDRNVFGLLEQFGDAELATLVAPRTLIVDRGKGPELTIPGDGGAPAELKSPQPEAAKSEFHRALGLIKDLKLERDWTLTEPSEESGVTAAAVAHLLDAFHLKLNELGPPCESTLPPNADAQRQSRMLHAIDVHNQWLLRQSAGVRDQNMSKLDTSSIEKYVEAIKPYREFFRNEVIGSFDIPLLDSNARSRKIKETDAYVSYDVVLDVMPGVFAYGILLKPKNIKPDERRPVVVCQHGLEGRPQDVVQGDHRAYHDFAAKLAERGFVTFAPQNIYIFRDRFRTLQRKSYPIKKTLFSIMVPQHQQIVNWLAEQDYVDPERIAFYGLSYGGKSAMRIPALVEDYCLSICSADFNEWVWKNAATIDRYTYVRTGEYEIFEFDLGSTFNYSEMAMLIAPRPFMVERGHFDGVAPDEMVAYEFAKVRRHYQARLNLPDRAEIEWFVGPHTINGKGTFDFLHRHLRWPKQDR